MKTFVREFAASLKRPEVEEWADLGLFRPLAFLLVKAIFRTSLTPNHISVGSMILGVIAGVLLGFRGPAASVPAAILIFTAVVFDCADGQLARLKRNGTPLGRFIDGMVDYVVGASVYLGLGIGFAALSGRPVRWWALVAAAAASNILHSIVFDYYRNRYLAYVFGVGSDLVDDILVFREKYESLAGKPGQGPRRTLIRLFLVYASLQLRLSRDPRNLGEVDAGAFRGANKLVLRMWTFLGSSTQAVALVAALLLGRLDLYFVFMIVLLNFAMFVFFVVQSLADRGLKAAAAGSR